MEMIEIATLEITPQQLSNFLSRIDKTDTCWNWTGGKRRGYGTTNLGKPMAAHRVSYQLFVEVIPSSQHLDHICHNKACVNPKHLRQVTNKQNLENVGGAQKNNKTSGIRGVSWSKTCKKWRADVTHNRQRHALGYFNTIEEAEVAAIAKRNELFTHNDMDRRAS